MSNRATRAKHKAIIAASGSSSLDPITSEEMGGSYLSPTDIAANHLIERKASEQPGAQEISLLLSGAGAGNDTRLQAVSFDRWGDLPVRNETWIWEGIVGCTVVFRSADVARAPDEDVFGIARAHGGQGEMTIARKSDFTFVNHSFIVL